MKVHIFCKGKAISETPIDIGKKTLDALRPIISGMGSTLPSAWQFMRLDDALPVESERGVLASLIAVDGKIVIAATPSIRKSTKPAATVAAPPPQRSASTMPAANAAGKSSEASAAEPKPSAATATPTTASRKTASAPANPVRNPTSPGTSSTPAPKDAAKPPAPEQPFSVEAPKPLTGTLDPDAFKSFQELWKAALEGGEAIKNPSGTHTAFAVFDSARLRGKFPLLVMADNALSLKDDAIYLDLPSIQGTEQPTINRPLRDGIRINIHSDDIRDIHASESSLLRDLHGSSAFKLVYSAGAEGNIDGAMLGGEDSVAYENTSQTLSKRKTRSVHVSSVRRVTKASITLPRELIHVSADIQAVFANALDALERTSSSAAEDPQALGELLKDTLHVLGSKGALVPRTYLLGGQITSKEELQSNQTLTSIEDAEKITFEQKVNADVKELDVKVKAKTQVGNTQTQGSTDTSGVQNAAKRLHMTGGAAGLAEAPAAWVKSLEDPTTWEIIGYDNCLPIWEFFNAPLRTRWRRFASRFSLALQTEIKKEYAKHDNLVNLLKDRAQLQERNTDSIRASFGIANLSGSSMVQGTPWQVSEDWKLTGFASKQAVQLDQGEVITYISIFTAFSPPGTWQITAGGVLESELRMTFTQESLRGMSWHVDVQKAKRSDIEVSPRFHAINALYQAMIAAPV